MLQEGYGMLAQLAVERKWVLYKLRPKLHMQGHLMSLGIIMHDLDQYA